jgi:hypothetical protein
LGICFFSCGSIEKNRYETVKQIEFDTGFNFTQQNCGIYYDYEQGKDCFYFGDPLTAKCIKTFSIDGKLKDSIPISSIFKEYYDEIRGICVFSSDTVILTTSYTNKIAHINNKGEIIKKIKIDSLLTDTLKYNMQFYPSSFSNVSNSPNTLLFRSWAEYDDVFLKRGNSDTIIANGSYYLFKEEYSLPYFLLVKGFTTNKIVLKFGGNDIYQDLYGDDNGEYTGANIDFTNFFKYAGSNIFMLSSYSDCLYEIDGKELNISNKIKIESKHTTIGVLPFICDINDSSYIEKRRMHEKEILIHGMLENILYNKSSDEYYVFVSHTLNSVEECDSYGDYGTYRPFSIIVYDNKFENPREYKFEGNKYSHRISFVTNEGLAILRKNNNAQDYGKQIFDIIKFN